MTVSARAAARAVSPIVALVLLVPAARAQLSVLVVTKTPMKVATLNSTRSIRADMDITAGHKLETSTSSGTCYAYARSIFTPRSTSTGVQYELKSEIQASTFPCSMPAVVGANDVRVLFKSSTPVAGQLLCKVSCSATSGVSCRGSIDVGEDNQFELASGSKSFDAVVGPAGLSVILRGYVYGLVGGRATSTVSVQFVPTPGRITVSGSPCGGPALDAYYTGSLFQSQAGNVPAGQYALFAVGTRDPDLLILPGGCRLRTDLLAVVGVPVSTAGKATLRVPITRPITGVFRTQFMISSGGAWRMSNALSIKLP